MSRAKINRRTDREQYTRSNAATARPLAFARPAETLARACLNRIWDVSNHIAEYYIFANETPNRLGLCDMYYIRTL